MKKPIIVGYDPGTTAALAILDTKGQILFLKSERGFKKGEIVDTITRIGKPLMIAGDRCPLPKSVEKLASSLGCKTFHPTKTLSTSEKEELVHEFVERVEDDHEKDALASAIKAFKVHSRLFEKTKNLLSSLGLSELYEKVVDLILRNEVENINEAINKLTAEKKQKIPEISVKEDDEKKSLQKTINRLQDKIKGLERDVTILRKYNQSLKDRLRDYERKFEFYRKNLTEKIDLNSLGKMKRELDILKDELKKKESLIEMLKTFRSLELEGYIPLLEVKEIRDGPIKDLNDAFDLENRIILVENIDNAQILNDYRIKALVTSVEPSKRVIEKVDFPIIVKKDISIKKVKDTLVIDRDELENRLMDIRKIGLVQWLESYRKRKL
ncbi:MAG: DUF460 domain-containing protein [Candidatus Aenigmarchaeota archaeon]|nr:DUF460 domain-containing protein [Candidatus Aenigmarchaeota archaeon]